MRMGDQGCMGCVRLALVEQGFQLSRWSLEKESLDSVRHALLLPERNGKNHCTAQDAKGAKENPSCRRLRRLARDRRTLERVCGIKMANGHVRDCNSAQFL